MPDNLDAERSEWKRTKPAARYCKYAGSTLEKFRSEGGGPPYSKVRGIVVYRVADLDRWLESGRRASTAVVEAPADQPAPVTRFIGSEPLPAALEPNPAA